MGPPRSWHAGSGDEPRKSWRGHLKRSTGVWPFEPSSVPTKGSPHEVGGVVQRVVGGDYSTTPA
jgi:hypothetical protein